MSPSNNQAKTISITFILIYAAVFFISLRSHQQVKLISLLNFIVSFSILLYWIRKQLLITKHEYELREMILLGVEILFLGISVFSFFIHDTGSSTAITAYAIFAIHFIVLIVALVFMLSFKIKKLF